MMNKNLDMLDDDVEGNMKVVGFDYIDVNKKIKTPSNKFIPLKKKFENPRKDHISQHHAHQMYLITEETRDHL